jgi:hypothetical protein
MAVQVLELRPETVRKLQERYKFVKVPTTFEELFPVDPNEGIKFQHGAFVHDGRTIVIELLQILPNILLAETRTTTDDADAFLDDYIQNANKERPDVIREFDGRLYATQLEFLMDRSLETYAPRMRRVAQQLDAFVAGYGTRLPPYRVVAISVNFNLTGLGGMVPAYFSLERRSGLPDEANVYFSNAPLKSSDHVALLNSLDREN